VFKPGKILLCLLMTAAGCSTVPRRGSGPRVEDWEGKEQAKAPPETEHVLEPPRLAPPPTSAPAPPPPRTNAYAETWVPLKRWSQVNSAGSLQRVSAGPPPVFALRTPNGTLVLRPESLVAAWNGQELHLGFAPQLIDNQPFVHALDLVKSIQPLLHGFALPAKTNRVIVVDPGHGGLNTGTRSVVDGTFEKEFTLDWARRLEPLLSAGGWQVFLTRTSDVDMSLADRVAFAEKHRADLFISLHFNATGSPTDDSAGLETYCLTPHGMPSTLTRGYEDDISLLFPNNAFDSENWRLAFHVQRTLLDESGAPDHGVRRARFMGVLRGQNRPAVLVEGGYLSSPREARQVADPAYRQTLAEAVAMALIERPETRTSKIETVTRRSDFISPVSNSTPQTPVVRTNLNANDR